MYPSSCVKTASQYANLCSSLTSAAPLCGAARTRRVVRDALEHGWPPLSVASTEGVIGKCPTASLAASIRIRARATLDVMVNVGIDARGVGSYGGFTALKAADNLPPKCR